MLSKLFPSVGASFRVRDALIVLVTTFGLLVALVAGAQEMTVVALEGDVVGDVTIYDSITPPALAQLGTLSFTARVETGSFDEPSAILRQGYGLLEVAVQEPHAFGSTHELYTLLGAGQTVPAINASHQILFLAEIGEVGASTLTNGLFRLNSEAQIVKIMEEDDPAVDGNGLLYLTLGNHPAFNQAGQAAFYAEVYDAVGGLGNGYGIYRGSGGPLTRIARTGQTPPSSSSFFEDFSWPSLNDSGEVAFVATVDGEAAGVYKGSGGSLVEIAREGDEPVAGFELGDVTYTGGTPINSSGKVALRADLEGGGDAFFLGDGTTIDLIAYGGQPAPVPLGHVPFVLSRGHVLNDQDQIAFSASQSNGNHAIFRASKDELVVIAYEGQTVPGSASQEFVSLAGRALAMNDRGDVAFLATFDAGTSFEEGLFFYSDSTGLMILAQPFMPLAGGMVEDVELLGNEPTEYRGSSATGLDEQGNVAFRFTLTDGRRGIAVAASPYSIFFDGFESGDTSAWSTVSTEKEISSRERL